PPTLVFDPTHLSLIPPTCFEPHLLVFGLFLTPPAWFSAPPICPRPCLFAFDPTCLFWTPLACLWPNLLILDPT
ncbi:hypothetical protein PAXRUDRAFT_153771, partial [Paxillus rubicundulus Ve08.2h10]